MKNIEKFTGLANEYTVGRPTYAPELIEYLYNNVGLTEKTIIADIGGGTGKLTKQLLLKGNLVYCVEPNDDMRNIAIKELSQYQYFKAIKGVADMTTLVDNSIDFITVAQAFHWFDVDKFKQECQRILKPQGKVALIWNIRPMTVNFSQESYALYKKYCPLFVGFGGGIKQDDERIKKFFDNNYEYYTFENPLWYDKETFIKRSLSGSYSLKSGDLKYQEYLDEIAILFDNYAINDILKMPNQTVMYIGSI